MSCATLKGSFHYRFPAVGNSPFTCKFRRKRKLAVRQCFNDLLAISLLSYYPPLAHEEDVSLWTSHIMIKRWSICFWFWLNLKYKIISVHHYYPLNPLKLCQTSLECFKMRNKIYITVSVMICLWYCDTLWCIEWQVFLCESLAIPSPNNR